jgi:hypothetical protein
VFDITRTTHVFSEFKNIFLPSLYIGVWFIKHGVTDKLDWRMRPLQQYIPWISDAKIKNMATITEGSVVQRHNINNVATTSEVSMNQRRKHKEYGNYNSSFRGSATQT